MYLRCISQCKSVPLNIFVRRSCSRPSRLLLLDACRDARHKLVKDLFPLLNDVSKHEQFQSTYEHADGPCDSAHTYRADYETPVTYSSTLGQKVLRHRQGVIGKSVLFQKCHRAKA